MFHSLRVLTSEEIPAGDSLPHLCTGAPGGAGPLGLLPRHIFVGPQRVPVSAAELQKPTCTLTVDGKPFLQRHFANLVLGLAILALHPQSLALGCAQSTMGFWPGFADVILSNSESLLAFFSRIISSLVSLTALVLN